MSRSKLTPSTVQEITPPTSWVDGPLTPPRSEEKISTPATRVIAAIQQFQRGGGFPFKTTTAFQLAAGEYAIIKYQLGEGGFGKIRYDYDAETHRFVIFMLGFRHEIVATRLLFDILHQLDDIGKSSGNIATFARDITPAGSAEKEYPLVGNDEASVHGPDIQFIHRRARYPAVVIEVADSQNFKDLPKLAQSYLLDSGGRVQVVVGIDLDYGPHATRKATISIWRLQADHKKKEMYVVAAPEREVFRDEHGNMTNSAGLRLQLSDFAPKVLSNEILGNEDCEISVSAHSLCEMLRRAETQESSLKRPRSNSGEHWIAGYKARRKSSTPPETIAAEDEVFFATQELRDAERADAADSSWEEG